MCIIVVKVKLKENNRTTSKIMTDNFLFNLYQWIHFYVLVRSNNIITDYIIDWLLVFSPRIPRSDALWKIDFYFIYIWFTFYLHFGKLIVCYNWNYSNRKSVNKIFLINVSFQSLSCYLARSETNVYLKK